MMGQAKGSTVTGSDHNVGVRGCGEWYTWPLSCIVLASSGGVLEMCQWQVFVTLLVVAWGSYSIGNVDFFNTILHVQIFAGKKRKYAAPIITLMASFLCVCECVCACVPACIQVCKQLPYYLLVCLLGWFQESPCCCVASVSAYTHLKQHLGQVYRNHEVLC